MKKAKIFLTALMVLAVVGGALSFKAKTPKILAQCNVASKICEINLTTTLWTITNWDGGTLVDYNSFGKPCVLDGGQWICKAFITFDLE